MCERAGGSGLASTRAAGSALRLQPAPRPPGPPPSPAQRQPAGPRARAHLQHVHARPAVGVGGARLADAEGRHRLQAAPGLHVQEVHVGVAVQHARRVQPAGSSLEGRWSAERSTEAQRGERRSGAATRRPATAAAGGSGGGRGARTACLPPLRRPAGAWCPPPAAWRSARTPRRAGSTPTRRCAAGAQRWPRLGRRRRRGGAGCSGAQRMPARYAHQQATESRQLSSPTL